LALTNREGMDHQNSGVTVLTIKNPKELLGQEYVTKTAQRRYPDYRRLWGE
jgi:hypothetical protein